MTMALSKYSISKHRLAEGVEALSIQNAISNGRHQWTGAALRRCLTAWLALALLYGGPPAVPAQAARRVIRASVITNCTEAGLDAALALGGSITFSCGGPTTIPFTSTKVISQATNIDGANGGSPVEFSGGGAVRLFRIEANVDVTLANLVLRDGHDETWFEDGGAIQNRGRLTVTHVVFEDNHDEGRGGAIFSAGAPDGVAPPATLTISNSTFTGNSANAGGAVLARGSLTITGATFRGNSADNGGALYIDDTSAAGEHAVSISIQDSLFEENHAINGSGGGLKYGGSTSWPLSLDNVTFLGNTSSFVGGGAELTHNCEVPNTEIQIRNSRFEGNSAALAAGGLRLTQGSVADTEFENNSANSGGGAWISCASDITRSTFEYNLVTVEHWNDGGSALTIDTGPVTITGSTFANNQVIGTGADGGTLRLDGSGHQFTNNTFAHNTTTSGASAIWAYDGGLTLTHNTIAGNLNLAGCTGECYTIFTFRRFTPFYLQSNILDNPGPGNCKEALDSLGHNLFSDAWCGPVATDVFSATAQLGPLMDYGGPTETRMPYTGSPARDGGGAGCPATDQRGVSRPVGAACDIGAVEADAELQPPPPAVPASVLQARSAPSQSGPASQSGYRTLSLAADPVSMLFGNFTFQHTDLSLPGFGPEVRLHRTYNSALPQDGILGWGWNLAYNLRVTEPAAGEVAVTRGDGRVDTFTVGAGGELIAPPGSADVLVENGDGSYTLTTREHLVYEFDAGGRLLTCTDADGNTVTLSHAGGYWTGITDAAGRNWSLAYNAADRLESVSDPAGRAVTFAYNAAGDLTSVTNPAGGISAYQYDNEHRLTQMTDANGHLYLANVYDETGRVVQQTDARGAHAFAYFDDYTLYTDPIGTVHRFDFDASYRLASRIDAYGTAQAVTTSLSYDAAGLVASSTDGNGHMTAYEYDTRGNVTRLTDALGHDTVMTYDGRDNLLSLTDPLGHTTTWTYNNADHPLTHSDALGHSTQFQYDSRGLLIQHTDALGQITTFAYDAQGNLTLRTDPLGAQTEFIYDTLGRVTQQSDPLGHSMAFTYDALNLLLAETAADGGVNTYAYDAVGNLLVHSDPLGHVTHYAYNDANDLIQAQDALGHVTTFTYNALGAETSRTLPDGTTWSRSYDALGRLSAVTSPLGHIAQYAYDDNDNLTKLTDAAGAATTYAYDALNRLAQIADAAGGESIYTYDAAGHMLALTDPLGHTTTYTYDALGRRLTQTDPLGNVASAVYDALSRVTSTTNGAGQTVNYAYDPVGRVLTVNGPGVNDSFTYDAAGRRTLMIAAGGATTYTHDPVGRLLSADGPQGLVSYAYDQVGRRATLSQPGVTLTYAYDALGQLTELYADGALIAGYGYDAAGRVTLKDFANGLTTELEYDADGRLSAVATTSGGGAIHTLAYQRDSLGNIVAETATGFTATFAYDSLSRLTEAQIQIAAAHILYLPLALSSGSSPAAPPALDGRAAAAAGVQTYSYTYDAAGNRLAATEDEVLTTYTYDAANRLTNPGYAYDAVGRLTSDGTTTYTYDALGRVLSADAASFVYDGDGNRVQSTVGGVTTDYLLDVGLDLPTRIAAAAGSESLHWHYGLGLAAQEAADGSRSYTHLDALGSVRLVTGNAGDVVEMPMYSPFGARLDGEAVVGFAGEPQDGALIHLRARDYSPALGRFLTPDPLAPGLSRTQGLHAYTYVENNPVNRVDPSGLCWLGPLCGAGQFIVSGGQAIGSAVVNTFSSAGAALYSLVSPAPPLVESSRLGSAGAGGHASASIISDKGAGLRGTSGSNILSDNGLGFIGNASGNLSAANGSGLIGMGSGNRSGASGSNLIGVAGGNLIGVAGGNILSDNGLGFIGNASGNLMDGRGPRMNDLSGSRLIGLASGNILSDNGLGRTGAGLIGPGGGNLIGVAGGN
jgi:RHS repeat-associated protein